MGRLDGKTAIVTPEHTLPNKPCRPTFDPQFTISYQGFANLIQGSKTKIFGSRR